MNILIRQDSDRSITSIEFIVDVDESIKSFREEMSRSYGSRCHIEEEWLDNGFVYKMYEYNNTNLLMDSLTIIKGLSLP